LSSYGSTPPRPASHGSFQAAPDVASPALASWRQRVIARMCDQVLIAPFAVVNFFFFGPETITTSVDGAVTTTESDGSVPLELLMALLALAAWGYNRWYQGGQGQSIGKKQMGLTLVSESTGQPIGWAKAFLRDLAQILDFATFFIGFLFPLWDQRRQTLADKISTTVVTSKA
jgi:uncharacterized RDD family membrane protein YckC